MPPKVNITLTIEGPLVDDLDDLAERLNTDRSPLICEAAKRLINDEIEDGVLDDEFETYELSDIDQRGVHL
jgi:metal-responsive CopG/Arc/MetJ family transcriptional regulator